MILGKSLFYIKKHIFCEHFKNKFDITRYLTQLYQTATKDAWNVNLILGKSLFYIKKRIFCEHFKNKFDITRYLTQLYQTATQGRVECQFDFRQIIILY